MCVCLLLSAGDTETGRWSAAAEKVFVYVHCNTNYARPLYKINIHTASVCAVLECRMHCSVASYRARLSHFGRIK